MKNLTVKDILKVTNGELIVGKEDFECKNFSKDTRIIEKGDTYIGLKGENFDGNLFWKEALLKGAECVIIQEIQITEEEKKEFANKIIIKVQDTLEALYKIASLKRSFYNIPVIAITGSVGKTSTKDMVSNVVSQKYNTLKTQGNNNNNIGLPFTILKLQDHEAMVLEMGMNHLGEISLLTKIAKPDICIITNVGTSHIGNLGSRENILKAKLEILEGNENATIIINNDNDMLHKWYEENKKMKTIKTYGIQEESDIKVKNIHLEEESSEFLYLDKNEEIKVRVPVAGEHFVLNSMCAILVGQCLEIDRLKIKKGIEEFELTKKRMDIDNLPGDIKIINDTYNASFESMQSSLKNLTNYNNRKIAILGDMFELGDYAKELHEKVGAEVAKNKIDILITSGENAEHIAKSAKKEGMKEENVYYFKQKENILELLEKIKKSGDVILWKASNGMRFFDLVEEFKKKLIKGE